MDLRFSRSVHTPEPPRWETAYMYGKWRMYVGNCLNIWETAKICVKWPILVGNLRFVTILVRKQWHSDQLVCVLYHRDLSLTLRFRLVGLVVKTSASGAGDPGFESRWRRDFSGSSHTSDLKIGTPVATLPGAWRYRVSAGTGRPGVSILWLGEVESLICSFYLSVAARKIVWADPSLRYTRMLLGR